MSKGLRNYNQEEVVKVVRRRLTSAVIQGKDWKPGLGTISALEYGPAVARRKAKVVLKDEKQ